MAANPSALEVLKKVASVGVAMNVLDDGASVLEHVSLRQLDGPDVRVDDCPCGRGVETLPVDESGQPVIAELGGGQYISSARHTLGDVVRDVLEA
ncbi:MAG TPA: hypothetical protein PLY51_12840 [Microthrixaceae bacterium]|nr:hypothetical protein [Myxococcota bacterium]HNH96449.1 hypothetical protein [Microthrixaceae bacterium]